eukprot:Hpha_TRINITY_DN14193_c0_g2::TRINITY_DN14193_c0_g2_i1::g.10759::m.10759/K08766/CPT2; carnitine O-palmitoyltransferase 2
MFGARAPVASRLVRAQRRGYKSLEGLANTNHLDLPRLPIPKLDDTLDRYLQSIEPLVGTGGIERQREMVEALRNGSGPKLQQALVERDAGYAAAGGFPHFYFEKYWDDGYLAARCPNTVHISPYYVFADAPDGDKSPSSRAARFVTAVARWMLRLRQPNGIEPDGGDMSQLARFPATARIPGVERDSLEFHAETSRHIVVQCGGKFFRVEVIQPDGNVVSNASLRATFESIIAQTPPPLWGSNPDPSEIGVGILTTEDRDVWAKVRTELIEGDKSGSNKRSLHAIDSAFFSVALDHIDPAADNGLRGRCRSLLHGIATPHRTHCNRWYDKHQLVADGAGGLGMVWEHSYSDGGSWNRALQDIWADSHAEPASAAGEALHAEPLTFELSESVKLAIQAAETKCRKDFVNGLDHVVTHFDIFGKKTIKTWKLSPDAVVQQAFQLAYHRLHGESAATYEACAMRNFFHGRTETIRSLTLASQAFVRAVADQHPKEELIALLKQAVAAQQTLAKAASVGEGIDRHLLALKMEWKEHGICNGAADLELFEDKDFQKSSTWTISTSNVTQDFINVFGFGAVTGDGYGLGYQIFDDHIPLSISSFKGHSTSSSSFHDAVYEALIDISLIAS